MKHHSEFWKRKDFTKSIDKI